MRTRVSRHSNKENLTIKNIKLDDLLREQLQDKRLAALYLEECFAYGNTKLLKKALKDVAEAQQGRTQE